jgi:hypothetical protein
MVLRELARESLSLEDVFVRLTRHDDLEPAQVPEEGEVPPTGAAAPAPEAAGPPAGPGEGAS